MQFEIKPFTAQNIEAITALHNDFKAAYAQNFNPHYYKTLPSVNETFAGFLQLKLTDEDFICFIAINKDGNLIGYITGFINLRSPIYVLNKIGYLSNLYVTQAARNKGIAQALYANLEQWFATKNIAHIEVSHNTADDYANKFYTQLGFKSLTTHLIKPLNNLEAHES
jgi:ribosomal protein S18 acetylase RimI-like enzyme